jgi:hypothetical protein
LSHAETAVKLAPDKPEHVATLAEVHFRRGDRGKAVELVKRCIEKEPEAEAYREQLERFQAE